MIYKKIFEEAFDRLYNEIASNSIILFGSYFVDEDVKVTGSKGFKLNIRTKSDGGRSGKDIKHGVAVKAFLNNEYLDLFVNKQKDGTYKCEIDRHKNAQDQKNIKRNSNYKVAKKFIEKNGELLVKIYNSKEGSKEFNDYIDQVKEKNPEFKYSK